MYTVRKFISGNRTPGAVFVRGTVVLVTFLVLLSLLAGCAGSGTSTDTDSETTPRSDVRKERLETLLDKQQRQRLKPSENSPGPVMVTLFTRQKKFSNFGTGARNRSPGQSGGKSSGTGQRTKNGGQEFQYLILMSKEWAYENRPVQEPFLDFAQPGVKVMKDWKMNRFLTFLNENKFKKFPSTGRVSPSDIRNLSGSEKFMTVWRGNRFRRVYFSEELRERMVRLTENGDEGGSPKIKTYSTRLLIGFIRAYNAAGRNRMQVEVGPSRQQNRLQEFVEQASPDEDSQDVKAKLYKARALHKKGRHRRAKTVLTNIIDDARGTTYFVDVRNLLHSVNQALNTTE